MVKDRSQEIPEKRVPDTRYNFGLNQHQSPTYAGNHASTQPSNQSEQRPQDRNQSNASRQETESSWGSVFKDRVSFVEMHVM